MSKASWFKCWKKTEFCAHLLEVGASGSCRVLSGHKAKGQEAETKLISRQIQDRNSHWAQCRGLWVIPSGPYPGPALHVPGPGPHKAEASRPCPGQGWSMSLQWHIWNVTPYCALWRAAQIFTWEAAESNETFLRKRKIKSVWKVETGGSTQEGSGREDSTLTHSYIVQPPGRSPGQWEENHGKPPVLLPCCPVSPWLRAHAADFPSEFRGPWRWGARGLGFLQDSCSPGQTLRLWLSRDETVRSGLPAKEQQDPQGADYIPDAFSSNCVLMLVLNIKHITLADAEATTQAHWVGFIYSLTHSAKERQIHLPGLTRHYLRNQKP